MNSWGKWILAIGIAGFSAQSMAKQRLIVRVNTQTNVVEVKTPRGWMATRQVKSENEEPGQVTVEPTGWWGYRGWIGSGYPDSGYYNGYYGNGYYGYGYGYGYDGYYGYGGYNSPDSTYYVAPYYSGISTSYWNAYPDNYYFYTPTWTLYYNRLAYDPVNWFTRGLFNYYYYNL